MTGIDDISAIAQSGMLKAQAVVITDWRDGPLEGIARLSVGHGLWKFRLLAEIPSSDDLNERLFLFSQLSKDLAEPQMSELIADRPFPLMLPLDDEADADAITSAVNFALESAMPATLVASSRDFNVVIKVWLVAADFN